MRFLPHCFLLDLCIVYRTTFSWFCMVNEVNIPFPIGSLLGTGKWKKMSGYYQLEVAQFPKKPVKPSIFKVTKSYKVGRVISRVITSLYVPWSRLSCFFGDKLIPPLMGILIMGPYKSLLVGWWVYPLLYGNNGSLDPGTSIYRGEITPVTHV